MSGKPEILKEGEYTMKKLIKAIGGNKDTWNLYFEKEEFSSKFNFLVKRRNLLKFKLLVPELELQELYQKEKEKRLKESKVKNMKYASKIRMDRINKSKEEKKLDK